MSVTVGLFRIGLTLRTHVACVRPSEVSQDPPLFSSIEGTIEDTERNPEATLHARNLLVRFFAVVCSAGSGEEA